MSTINLPGFTAELSLYDTDGAYRGAWLVTRAASPAAIVAQDRCTCPCCAVAGGTLYCCDRPRPPA